MSVRSAIVVLAALAVAGCSAISAARKAQSAAESTAAGERADAPMRVDLADQDLAGLVGFALTNRPSVVRARLAVEEARLALKTIAADAPLLSATPWTAPSVSVRGGFSGTEEASQDLHNAVRTHRGTLSAALSIDLLIWDFGRYGAKAEAQREQVIAAELELGETGYTVFEEVTSACFNLLERDALLDVALTNELEFALHLEQAEKRVEIGEAQDLDVLKARLDLARAREETLAASNAVVTAAAKLACALGLEASEVERENLLPRAKDALCEVRQGFAATSDGAEALYAFARTNAPASRIARARLRAASAGVDAAIADLLPEVSVSASLSWTDPMWAYHWGVSAVQSLFQGFRKTTAVDRARVSLERAEADVVRIEQELSRDIEIAVAERDNAREARVRAEESLRQARENFDVVRSRYDVGDASRIDFVTAITAMAEAMGGAVRAFYSGQRAEAAIFKLTGEYPVFDERTVDTHRPMQGRKQ